MPPAVASNELLIVNPRVANWQTLATGVAARVDVVVLDASKDGIKQVTELLARRSQIEAVHFLEYGKAGEIDLGSTAVTAATLAADAEQIGGWSRHLSPIEQLDFWGCEVGAGTAGQAFVATLHSLPGAGVAASTDATGGVSLHGNWTLQQRIGVDAVRTPFSAAAMQAYAGVLDRPLPAVSFSGVAPSVLLGLTFTESVTFQNTAANGVG